MLFHEIYSTYFQTVGKILTEAVEHPLTTGEISSIIQNHAFEESALNIPESLGMARWQLLKEDGTTILRKKANYAPYDFAETLDQCDRIRSKNTFVYGSTSCIFRCGTVISSRRYLRL